MKTKKTENRIWAEIKTDYTEEATGITHVDAWVTGDENEDGRTIATIDDKGFTTYIDERAKKDEIAQEEIQDAIRRIEDARYKLIDKVIERLKVDFLEQDYTVIDELLKEVPMSALLNSLPEE